MVFIVLVHESHKNYEFYEQKIFVTLVYNYLLMNIPLNYVNNLCPVKNKLLHFVH